MGEREKLTEIAKRLLPLLNLQAAHRNTTQELMLELSQRLGNIAGFCDDRIRERVHEMQRLITLTLANQLFVFQLRVMLPFMVGLQIDFSERPFRAVGLSLEGWGTNFKPLLEK